MEQSNNEPIMLQRLTYKEKIDKYETIEKWCEVVYKSISSINNFSGLFNKDYYTKMQSNWDLSVGRLHDAEYSKVLQQYGETDTLLKSFPIELKHYDICTNKIEVLKGEEIKRPFNYTVICVNEDAVSEKEQKYKEMLLQLINRKINKVVNDEQLQQQNQQQNNNKEQINSVEDLNKYFKYEYQDIREITANKSLNYLVKFCNLLDKFNSAFTNYLIMGGEILYISSINNEPDVRVVDPRYFEFDKTLEIEFIEDAMWAKEIRYLTLSQIIDEYYDYLDDKLLKKLTNIQGNMNMDFDNFDIGNPILRTGFSIDNNYDYNSSSGNFPDQMRFHSRFALKVVNFEWKSLRKIGFLTKIDENGETTEEIVSEDYIKKDNETIDWKWINEVWEAVKIGVDVYIKVRPKVNQNRSLDNISKCKLSYTGIVSLYPMMTRMRDLQVLYNVMMFRFKLAIAKDRGKSHIMDITQIPELVKNSGIDLQAFMYYSDILGFTFINPYQEGMAKRNGSASSFNQFATLDGGNLDRVINYMKILEGIRNMLDEVSGIPRAREGDSTQVETLGGIERSITQSSHVTFHLFNLHDQVKQRVLTNLLEEAKYCWSNGKKVQFIMDDMSRQYLNLETLNMFIDSEYGVFVTNTNKDLTFMNAIEQSVVGSIQAAVQQGSLGIKDLVTILNSNSSSQAKKILELAEESKKLIMQQQQEEQKALIEQEKQKELEIVNLKYEKEKEIALLKIDSDNQISDDMNSTKLQIAEKQSKTNIEVANIYDDGESNNNSKQLEVDKFKIKSDIEKEKIKASAKTNTTKNVKK